MIRHVPDARVSEPAVLAKGGPELPAAARLFAVSDLHVAYPENRQVVADLRPPSPGAWLIVAGDVAELVADIEWALSVLSERFAKVIWVPGNHELWTHPRDPVTLRGVERYELLVQTCRRLGVITPEDPYPVWYGEGGPAVIAPLFLLYDYTFLPDGTTTRAQALALALETGVVCTDEVVLHPDPYADIASWCAARVSATERRLASLPAGIPTILVNHFPLVREPTRVLRHPEFAQWCGTVATADWPVRFNAATVVYGHLHIPRTIWHEGIRHVEVSLGYPPEWHKRTDPPVIPRQILPVTDAG